ncbi:MAG: C4-dicarboxylate ABC transporter substrate-binding protein [Betaproteobacteria bacterium]|nr:C4-dicarboxylate ABC transporter substrate-binding protein [Betaproteobacteria bacterium]
MPRVIRDTLVSVRELLITAGPFISLAAALLAGAYYLLKPTPPKRVVLATGPEQGAYAEFGKRYAEELKRYGIEVVLRPTHGARENLRQLQDPKGDVQVAFVQGGSSESQREAAAKDGKAKGEEDFEVMSLGSMFYEPVWIFYREDAARKINRQGMIGDFAQLRGLRVNVGARGSGTPGMTTRLLRANLMERDDIKRSNLDLSPSVVELLGGTLDAAVLVSAPESPLVQMLLQTPGIRLYEFAQAEAYARRYKFLSPVTLPRGVVDLSRNVPPRDTVLVAATCSLVAREDLHPALVQLFVQAAGRIHGGSGWIAHAGLFPSPLQSEFPLARDAERYYRTGPPLLQRYLPFWLANLVDRMWVALFSIAVILIPLARIVPPLYQYRIRSRIYRWYRDLRQIEEALGHNNADPAKLLANLEELDLKAERVLVPLAYTDELYDLRSHIALVRARLKLTMSG